MAPAVLDRILSRLPRQDDPNLLVGFAGKDDAAVYRLNSDLALVQTTDFFTPIVDDPYLYGQIAAANSLSDVYAMGGTPLTALSLVCYPETENLDILERILVGGIHKMIEAECTVVGGHSVRDSEVKFGYAVTGTINPERIWTNSGALPGDKLLLTKPLGTGVITTALRSGKAKNAWVEAAAEVMIRLNRNAAQALAGLQKAVHAVTDITGFGLMGHAWELASASKVSLHITGSAIELLDGALECAQRGFLAGGLKKNREFIGNCVVFARNFPADLNQVLFDPQTSGGLLASIASDQVEAVRQAFNKAGCPCIFIGEAVPQTSPMITVF